MIDPLFRRSDALLQFADFRIEVRLVTDGGRHAPEKRGNFRACLHKTENIVDEEEHVQVLLVAEVFRNGEACQSDAQARNQRRARFLRIAGDDNPGFGHFQPKVIAFARALANARKHGQSAVLHRYVVNQLQNDHGLANPRASKEADLSALHVRLDQVDDLDSSFKHFQRGGLIFERRGWAMNRVLRVANDRAKLIDGLPKNIHHAAQRCPTHRNFNPFSEVVGLHASYHPLDGLHGDGANAAFAQVLLDFRRHVQRFRYRVAFARNVNRVINRRKVPRLELNVHDRPDDLHDVPHARVFLCHALS